MKKDIFGEERIRAAFAGGKAFVAFFTCGDPDLSMTERVVLAAVRGGADLIELGIPFSDPTAEGPTIQEANARALAGGVTTDDIFALAARLRAQVAVPMVFMTYANVVFADPRFCARCREVGVDGLILPDLPFEEREEFAPAAREAGISLISLVAPTSRERAARIAAGAEGFLYVVRSLGVTGEKGNAADLPALMEIVRAHARVPCAIGFGIDTPEEAARVAPLADGVIVGSALVRLARRERDNAPRAVENYVRAMKEAIAGK